MARQGALFFFFFFLVEPTDPVPLVARQGRNLTLEDWIASIGTQKYIRSRPKSTVTYRGTERMGTLFCILLLPAINWCTALLIMLQRNRFAGYGK